MATLQPTLSDSPATGRGAREQGFRQRAEQLAAKLPPLLVAAERVAATISQGVHGRRQVGSGETFWQFRRYQFGDPANRIDWRQSAKSQHVFVRETEWEAAQSVWLWRDGSPSMAYRSPYAEVAKTERATLLLLAVAALLLRGGEYVALLGIDRQPHAGRAVLGRLAANLLHPALVYEMKQLSLPPDERLPRHAQVVMIGDFLAPLDEVAGMVRRYVARNVKGHLLQVLDPAEEDLPFTGRTEFRGLEGETDVTVSHVEALRGAYGARLAAHRQGLAEIAQDSGWSFATHRTDRPPQTALLALYQALASGEG